MKKLLVIAMFVWAISATVLQAQSDRIQPKIGFMYEFITLKPADSLNRNQTLVLPYYNLFIGGYRSFVSKNDVISLGADAAFQGGINFQRGISYQLMAPVHIVGKLGAGATSYNTQKVGIAVGAGALPFYMHETRITTTPLNKFFIFPSFMIEATLNTNGGRMTGRIQFNPVSLSPVYNLANYDWRAANVGLGLLYTL